METKNHLINKTVLQNECHIFIGYKDRDGYGILSVAGKNVRAHRYAYEIYNGQLPKNCVIHHTCHNRDCVNPNHLQAISPQSNVAEMLERQSYVARILELENEIFNLRYTLDVKDKIILDLETEILDLSNDDDDFFGGDN
jgi:hypothetical protein